jgi:two-component system CheB/CheR fusion protein
MRYHHLLNQQKRESFIDAWENNGYKSILILLLGYPKAELVKPIWQLLIFIIANKDAFKELKQEKSLHYENVQIETANGLEINVDFTLNTYITDSHVVIQCFIRNFTNAHSK